MRGESRSVSPEIHLDLGLVVGGIEAVIGNRPIAPNAVQRFDPEIVGHEPECLSGPVPGRSSDTAHIHRAIRIRTLLDQIVVVDRLDFGFRRRLRRIGLHKVALVGRVAEIFDELVPLKTRTGLEDQHRRALADDLQRSQAAGNTGADDETSAESSLAIDLRSGWRRAPKAWSAAAIAGDLEVFFDEPIADDVLEGDAAALVGWANNA